MPLEDRRISIGQSVILQAMAMGLAVITSDIGATRDYIEKDVTGLLVSPEDAKCLQSAIRRLIKDENLAARLGNSAKEQVGTRFVPQVTIPQVCQQIAEARSNRDRAR